MALFGADTWYYAKLADAEVIRDIANDYHLDRISRFHPATVAVASIWMTFLSPLAAWIAPVHILKAMFATIGALGVWAAGSAFAAVVPRRIALFLGLVYAASFGIWYFSSIEESKILTATLTTIYIERYLHLRQRWSRRGAIVLTIVLLLACLNEIVSGFLVIIPFVDAAVRYGFSLYKTSWIAGHALAAPIALAISEGIIGGSLSGHVAHAEGDSHLGMLFYYLAMNSYSLETVYGFVLNWFFFNIAAPASHAHYAVPAWPTYKGYFEPSLTQYFFSPVSAGLLALLGLTIALSWLPRFRAKNLGHATSLLLGLAAFSGMRGLFFIIFDPPEALLFSPAVTLAHLMLIGIPFAASSAPAKHWLLIGVAILLLINNASFFYR